MSEIEKLSRRWRYVTQDGVTRDCPVSGLRLLSGNAVKDRDKAFRFEVPPDMHLQKHPYQGYWFCRYDTRTLRRLGAVSVVRIHGKWKVMPELLEAPIEQWDDILFLENYQAIPDKSVGYLPLADYDDYMLCHGTD